MPYTSVSEESAPRWDQNDVYPPLAELRRAQMTDVEWAAMSEWDKDLWEMKHLPEEERMRSIEGVVMWLPVSQREQRRKEVLEEVLRFGEPAPMLVSSATPAPSTPGVLVGDASPTIALAISTTTSAAASAISTGKFPEPASGTSSSASASAASTTSKVLGMLDPTVLNVGPSGVEINVTDLAAMVPTSCSSECSSKNAPTSVSVTVSSTASSSSTTICGVVPELAAPTISDKAVDMDVPGDAAPTVTIYLPGSPEPSTNGEDTVSVSMTVKVTDPSFTSACASTCSTDCSCHCLELPMPSRLLPKTCGEFNVVSMVNGIAPWPPPCCTSARAVLIHGHDLFQHAQQIRGNEFSVKGSKEDWNAIFIEVELKPPWTPSLGMCTNLPMGNLSFSLGSITVNDNNSRYGNWCLYDVLWKLSRWWSHTECVRPANAIFDVSFWRWITSKHAEVQFQSWMLIIVKHLLQYGLEADALSWLISWFHVPCLQFYVVQGYHSSGIFLVVLYEGAGVHHQSNCTRVRTVAVCKEWIYHHILRGNNHLSELMQWSSSHSLLQSEFRFCTLDMMLAAASTVVRLLGTVPVTDVTSENGSSGSPELVFCIPTKLLTWSLQFKWPPMSLNGPFLIARNIQQDFTEKYSLTAMVSRLLTHVVRWDEAVHQPFFQSSTGKMILLPWDPGLSLQGASKHHQLGCNSILNCLCAPRNISILLIVELHWQYSSCRQPLPESFSWYIAWLIVGSSCANSEYGASKNLTNKWMTRNALHLQPAENAWHFLEPARPSATCDTSALLLILGWPDVLPYGVLMVHPFSTMVQVVTLYPIEVSLEKFAIPRVDYMMMHTYTPCSTWMLLNVIFLQAGISSYFKGNPCLCGFELFPWKFAWTVSRGYSGNFQVGLAFTCTSYACAKEFHHRSSSGQTSRMFFAKVTTLQVIKQVVYSVLIIGRKNRSMRCNTWTEDIVPTPARNQFPLKLFVIKHWIISWDPGDALVQHLLKVPRPQPALSASRLVDMSSSYVPVPGKEFHGPWDPGGYTFQLFDYSPGYHGNQIRQLILATARTYLHWDHTRGRMFVICYWGSEIRSLAVHSISLLHLPWDPGGLNRRRLEDKPNFMGEGLSATYLYSQLAWRVGRHSWAGPDQEPDTEVTSSIYVEQDTERRIGLERKGLASAGWPG